MLLLKPSYCGVLCLGSSFRLGTRLHRVGLHVRIKRLDFLESFVAEATVEESIGRRLSALLNSGSGAVDLNMLAFRPSLEDHANLVSHEAHVATAIG